MPSSKPTCSFDKDATYLIAGGLGGLGRSITRWMVDRGASYFISLSRAGAKSKDAIDLIEEMKTRGVTVAAPPCDVSVEDAVSTTLEECKQIMPPIKGCIQASMVLKVSPCLSSSRKVCMLILHTGRIVREPYPLRFQRSHQTKSPRFLEPAQTSPSKPRLLRPSVLSRRRNRNPRPKQLRGRKFLPRCPGSSPCLYRRESHLSEPRSHSLHRCRGGERSQRIPRSRRLRRASERRAFRLAGPLLRSVHTLMLAMVFANTHGTGRHRARTPGLLDAETPLQHPAPKTHPPVFIFRLRHRNGRLRDFAQISDFPSHRRRRSPPSAEGEIGGQSVDSD